MGTSSLVAAAAGRCLQQLVSAASLDKAADGSAGAADTAAELLERRDKERMEFEQFVFPFVALVHRPQEPDLVVRRLEICRAYLSAAKPPSKDADEKEKDNEAFRRRMPTCVAAGFVAAALARSLGCMESRPSTLLCGICRDLMGFVAVEDSEFRARVARILGFFDILTH